MKNWKRILAAVGTAALLVSNVGAVSQVVFADEGDIVESVAENVVDVSEGDVSAQVQEIIDEAIAVSEEPSDESQQDQPEIPAESTEVITEGTTESEPAEETPAPTDPIETPEPVEGDETTADDETVSDESATTEDDEEIVDETVEDETVVDETTVDETVEDETDVDEDPADEETEEEPLVSPEYEKEVPVTSKDGSESGITVKATAEPNIIPEGAILVARLIEEDTKEYQEVEQALIDSEDVDYTGETQTADTSDDADDEDTDDSETAASEGFIAMDIHFEVKQPVKADDAQIEDAENVDAETEDADDASTETDENADIEYEYVEVEPNGLVNITFDLEENVLPVEADPDTLTVHHIVEDEDGNVDKIETVADTDDSEDSEIDGLVQAAEAPNENTAPEVKAEFQVESFSTFCLRWTDTRRNAKNEFVYIHYVDENGYEIKSVEDNGINDSNRIEMAGKNPKADKEKELDLTVYAEDIDGYAFTGIKISARDTSTHNDLENPNDHDYLTDAEGNKYVDLGSYDTAQFVKYVDGGNKADSIKYYKVTGYYEDDEEDSWNIFSSHYGHKTEYATYTSVGDLYQTADVYLVYKEVDKTGAEFTPPTVGSDKTVTDNNNGTYDLTLSVSGASGNQEQQVDVLFVLDTSSSMIKNWASGSPARMHSRGDLAEQAIKSAVKSLQDNKSVDARFGLVTFSSYSLTQETAYAAKDVTGNYIKNKDGSYSYVEYDKNNRYTKKGNIKNSNKNGDCGDYVKATDGSLIDRDDLYRSGAVGVRREFSSDSLDAALAKIVYAGNTNYQAAINGTRLALADARKDAKKIVIFLTDGMATQAFNSEGGLWGTGREDDAKDVGWNDGDNHTTRATRILNTLPLSSTTGDAFYTVAIGTNITTDYYNTYLSGFNTKSNYKDQGITTGVYLVDSDDSSRISDEITGIIERETRLNISDVHVEDPLSDYVRVTKTDDKYDLTVAIVDKDNQPVDTDPATPGIQVQRKEGYNKETKQYEHIYTYTATAEVVEENAHQKITLDFITSDSDAPAYQLETGWTYKVTAKVEPTEAAYTYYRDNQIYDTSKDENNRLNHNYADLADLNTGTYAAQKGLYTNGYIYKDVTTDKDVTEKATVKYRYEGSNRGTVEKQVTSGTVGDNAYQLMNSASIANDGKVTAKVVIVGLGSNPDSKKVQSVRADISVRVTVKDRQSGKVVKTVTLPLQDYSAVADGANVAINIADAMPGSDYSAATHMVEIVSVAEPIYQLIESAYVKSDGKVEAKVSISGLGTNPSNETLKAAIAKTSIRLTVKDKNGDAVETVTLPLKDRTPTADNGNLLFDLSDAITGSYSADTAENTVEIVNVVSEEQDYPEPVIRLNPGYLTITKTITGLDASSIDTAVNNTQFKVTVTKPDGTTKIFDEAVYNLSDATEKDKDIAVTGGFIRRTDTGNDRTYVITLYGLDTGSTYTVTEVNPDGKSKPGAVEQFDVDNGTTTVSSVKDTVDATKDTTIKWNAASATSFINTYTKKIVKTGVVTDSNMFPALVATIDIMAAMFVVYGIAKRRGH